MVGIAGLWWRAEKVAVMEYNVAAKSDQKRDCCSERVAVVEYSVVTESNQKTEEGLLLQTVQVVMDLGGVDLLPLDV